VKFKLKDEFEKLKKSIEFSSDDFSREKFEGNFDIYHNFLEWLVEIVELPRNKIKNEYF